MLRGKKNPPPATRKRKEAQEANSSAGQKKRRGAAFPASRVSSLPTKRGGGRNPERNLHHLSQKKSRNVKEKKRTDLLLRHGWRKQGRRKREGRSKKRFAYPERGKGFPPSSFFKEEDKFLDKREEKRPRKKGEGRESGGFISSAKERESRVKRKM